MLVRNVFENVGVINRGVPLGDFRMPPTFQPREHHEKAGRAIALIFVIVGCGAARAHRDRRPRFLDELLAGPVHAHQRNLRVAREVMSFDDILNGGCERRVLFERNDHCFLRWGLRMFFLTLLNFEWAMRHWR